VQYDPDNDHLINDDINASSVVNRIIEMIDIFEKAIEIVNTEISCQIVGGFGGQNIKIN